MKKFKTGIVVTVLALGAGLAAGATTLSGTATAATAVQQCAALARTAGDAMMSMSCCAPKGGGTAEARPDKGVQRATVVIDGGYTPATVKVKVGQPVELTFERREKGGCGSEVRFAGLDISRTLKTGEKTVVKFTPQKAGNYSFSCAMGMYQGQVVAQ